MNKKTKNSPSLNEWINDVAKEDQEKVLDLFHKANTFKKRLDILQEWHPKGYINLVPISTLEDYFKYIRLTANNSTWYRGESKAYENLTPKLYRGIKEDEIDTIHEKERLYFLEFRRRNIFFLDRIKNS